MPYISYYAQATDPGASAGAGAMWADISVEPPNVQVRNKTNTGWDPITGAVVTGPAAPNFALGTANVIGAALTYAPTDSTIAIFDTTVPVTQAFSDVAATGSAAFAARRDHRHGMPASPAVSFAAPSFALGTANSAGVAATAVRSDAGIAIFDTTVPVTQNYNDVAATGSAAFAARRDHVHGMPAAAGTTFAVNTFAYGTATAAGVATTAVRTDATLAIFDATVPVTQAFSDAAATGSAAFAARRDHKHGMPANPTPSFAAPSFTLTTANATGAAATIVRSDASIAIFDGTVPVTQAFGDAAATGAAAFAARRDHVHGMPARPFSGVASLSANVAVGNSETQIIGTTLPSGLTAGAVYRITVFGRVTTGATGGNSVFRIRVGSPSLSGNVAATQTLTNNNSQTDAPFMFTGLFTIYTTGAGGTCWGNFMIEPGSTTAMFIANGNGANANAPTTATVAINTTVGTNILEVTAISGNAGSTINCQQAIIERVI